MRIRQGVVGPGLEKAVQAFRTAASEHRWYPTSCTVYKDGVPKLELYAGVTARGQAFGPSHVSTVQSVSKVVMGLSAVMLQDRGLLCLADPIAKHWPEFERKEITVRELLAHTAGLYTLTDRKPLSFFRDRGSAAVADYLADGKHFDQACHGKIVYHCLSGGWIFSQICARVDPKGRYLGDFCREEIFEPLGLNMEYGMSRLDFDSSRNGLFCSPPHPPCAISDYYKSLLPIGLQQRLFAGPPLNGLMPVRLISARSILAFTPGAIETVRHGLFGPGMFVNEVGSGNLVSNTGALAQLGAVLAAGGAPLVSSPSAITHATRVFVQGYDPVFESNVAFTECGWSPITKFSESPTLQAAAAEENGLVGWWGIGGQLFVFSPARNLSFAFQSSLCSVTHGPRLPAYSVLENVLSVL